MKRFNRSAAASALSSDGDHALATTDGASPQNAKSSSVTSPDGPFDKTSRATNADQASTAPPAKKRKTKAKAAGSKLSFGVDEDEDEQSMPRKPKLSCNEDTSTSTKEQDYPRTRIGANKSAGFVPKVITKHTARLEAEQREILRQQARQNQDLLKDEQIVIPFEFFAGAAKTVTGRVKMKKGDTIDALLSGAQKVLVREDYKKWVHLKLDDLMLVRNGVMIPHYLTVLHFILKRVKGPGGPLFGFSADPSDQPGRDVPDSQLEGNDHDPSITKVVDVNWYKNNKHIFPCNIWEWYDSNNPDKDYGYAKTARRDVHGNSFFG